MDVHLAKTLRIPDFFLKGLNRRFGTSPDTKLNGLDSRSVIANWSHFMNQFRH
jgi:hypothetical protein